MFHFSLVLLFLLLVVAFQNFVAGEFVEGTVFVHEDDVVAVFAGGNYGQVFEDAVFSCAEGFRNVEGHVFDGVADSELGILIYLGSVCRNCVVERLCYSLF